MSKWNDPSFQGMSPELLADLRAIESRGPSLEGRVKASEELKELQARFAKSAEARGVDLERVSESAFEEMHPGHTRNG